MKTQTRARRPRDGARYIPANRLHATRVTPAPSRKVFLARIIRQSMLEGEKIAHPVAVAVCAERQWDGKWFDVTLTSDGETISVASFRRIRDARAYRKRMIKALRIPGFDARARIRRALKKRRVMAIEKRRDLARRP